MVSDEDNELMCLVEGDAPMGRVMRQFWIPALLSTELAERDGDPVHVKLLGQDFVAFRDSNGKVGLLDEHCCHRGASLTIGRVENCGIRCIYHGWLFDADGTVLETPNVNDPKFKERFKARAYPVREAGGFIWAYLGDTAHMPPLPDFPWMEAGADMRLNTLSIVKCNFVQLIEALHDSSHLGVLHVSALQSYSDSPTLYAKNTAHMLTARQPRIEAEDTEFGMHYAAMRDVDGRQETRVAAFISPFWSLHPHGDLTIGMIPMSNTETAFFNVWWDGTSRFGEDPLRSSQLEIIGITDAQQRDFGLDRQTYTEARAPSRANGFHQDRDLMRKGHFSGIRSLMMEDIAVAQSAGPIRSRSNEHLSTSDAAIGKIYRILIKSARSVANGGAPVFSGKSVRHIVGRQDTIDPGTPWQTIVPENRQPAPENA